jgi:hypothetical protein
MPRYVLLIFDTHVVYIAYKAHTNRAITGNRGQVVFKAPQVKAAAEKLVSMNDVHETIVPDEGRPWPHDYENYEGGATKNAQVSRYVTYPLLQGETLYTNKEQNPGMYRVTLGFSNTNKPVTLNVVS